MPGVDGETSGMKENFVKLLFDSQLGILYYKEKIFEALQIYKFRR